VTSTLAPNACGNQLQTYKDTAQAVRRLERRPRHLRRPLTPIDKVDSIKVLEDGPLRKTIRIERTWQSSHFIQDISLDAGADTVRVSNDIDWHETHVLLKAAFPLAASGPKATYEIPYGAIERPTTRNNSWEKAQFEVPAQRWADLGDAKQGVSILNDSKYGYDAVGNTLRLTLLRSPTWPDPDADRAPALRLRDLPAHRHLASKPKPSTAATNSTRHSPPSRSSPTPALSRHSLFASVEKPNVILSAVKKAEDSDALIFRVYEWAGRELTSTSTSPQAQPTPSKPT
jgi:alpha-mannosidase